MLTIGTVVMGVGDLHRADVERLVSLGATRVAWDLYPEDPDFIVLGDPEGNRFCVIDTGRT